MTSIVRWVLYFRYSTLLKMRSSGVMSNQFLRKLQELLENRYDDPTFCLRCHVLDCEANFVLLVLIIREYFM
jgi:hypothetical protein